MENGPQYLEARGWEQSGSPDNWVRSDATYKEANTGISTLSAYHLQQKIDKGELLIKGGKHYTVGQHPQKD